MRLPVKRSMLLVVVGAVTLWLGAAALGLRMERGNESMNAADPEQVRIYDDFLATFGSDDMILFAVTRDDLLDPPGMLQLDALTAEIEALPGTARVLGLSNAPQVVSGSGGATTAPLVPRPYDGPAARAKFERALERNPHLTGLFVSRDRRTAGIAIEPLAGQTGPQEEGRLIDDLRSLAARHRAPGVSLHLTGLAVQKHDAARFVRRDQQVFLPASVAVLALVLGLMLRRPSGVLLPLGVTAITLCWTLGIYALLGYELNIVTSLLAPTIMALSLTTSVHLYQEWLDLAEHATRRSAAQLVRAMVRYLFVPCALTALTTALGLLSLTVADIPAVRQFGMFAALGIGIAFVLNITLIPLGLTLLRPPPKRAAAAGPLERLLQAAAHLSTTRPGQVLAVALVLFAAGIALATRIENNTDLVRFLKSDAPLYRDTMHIDRNLTGPNALELVVERRDGAALTAPDDVARLARLQDAVRGLPHVGTVVGLPDLLRQIHRAERDADDLELPSDPDDVLLCFDLLELAETPTVRGLITPDLTRTRMTVRLATIGTARAARVLARILALADDRLGAEYRVTPTGSFHAIIADSTRLVESQFRSFALALGLILLAIGAVFRSRRLFLAALIPNVVPLAWTAGVMGLFRIDLSTGTAMIASVFLGVAVDDTIHYLARFRREFRGDPVEAITRATPAVGRALVTTSVVLALGFWVGCFGSFKPTIYFSLLTGVTILGALLCDLLVLPACLMLVRPRTGEL